MDASGKVLATSLQSHQSYVGKKNTSLAVSRALQGIRDNEEEFIDEDGMRKKIIAKPVNYSGKIVGAVYMVASMKELYQTVDRINRIFMSGMLIALGLTGVLGILLAHTITSPIKGADEAGGSCRRRAVRSAGAGSREMMRSAGLAKCSTI